MWNTTLKYESVSLRTFESYLRRSPVATQLELSLPNMSGQALRLLLCLVNGMEPIRISAGAPNTVTKMCRGFAEFLKIKVDLMH
jgi:hypothetical protein